MATNNLQDIKQGTAVTNPVASFSKFLDKFKPQLALALPKHLNVDRMARLAVTCFSKDEKLQACSAESIVGSLMTASTLGLEPGVNGQGYLIPYGRTCTFVPGWKGLVDLVSRSGRATVWTGAVFEGDEFDYQLGDSPFVNHRPGDEDDPKKLTHVYAIGRVNGSELPIIEVWTIKKIWKHRDKYNKVGKNHYSFRDPEMYARKVPLLQVLKYLPSSVELSRAIAAANAAEEGKHVTIDGEFIMSSDPDMDQPRGNSAAGSTKPAGAVDNGTGEIIDNDDTALRNLENQTQNDPTIKFGFATVKRDLEKAKTQQELDEAASQIQEIASASERDLLSKTYKDRLTEFKN